ncbi:mannose-6-phosphate isomerase [Fulvivirga sp. M361]|uniref:class I mannose-6-phosphate isomerase n=1 Tax=Fulvivirga sp. M361 TaxID=2594266 RepID=UPI00117AFE0C|nr:class I mannose-6-phosphate isomerase [Fulvivirga sp. M361]TRX59600.1 mannose-6-phosphate isomerase [Fulvivirga sp. M361]
MTFNKFPSVKVNTPKRCLVGWPDIAGEISKAIETRSAKKVVIECYQGVFVEDIKNWVQGNFPGSQVIDASIALKSEEKIRELTAPDVTDDRIFGVMTQRSLLEFFHLNKISKTRQSIEESEQLTFVIGTGASFLALNPDIYIYADMARWEIQQRMRKKEVSNVGLNNTSDPFETQYKRGYFLDWRICDQHKQKWMPDWDYVLDTNNRSRPKMITAEMFHDGIDQAVNQPFSVVPFFDPGPWGGQWMREKFDLDPEPSNFAWCFNCVPEENSLLLDFDGVTFETPSINLVFFKPKELLGEKVQDIFGNEFPIRFDFLDTMGGGNLSLQVHPLTDYIREKFGMTYTQDESYYMLDTDEKATVYLGLKENVDRKGMITALTKAQSNGHVFDADKYTQKWPAKKHDHFLIPAGTVHCSGEGCMVLEISATPYIFTFKLWDWGRLGMDGKPRPINIEHGKKVIQWNRQSKWTQQHLINNIGVIAEGEDWREERTGLHQLEFIETRRHWHSGTVLHQTKDRVNVLMVVEGEQAVVESPTDSFQPFVVNYAEAFIIPAKIREYTIRPIGASKGKEIATLKAYVRT